MILYVLNGDFGINSIRVNFKKKFISWFAKNFSVPLHIYMKYSLIKVIDFSTCRIFWILVPIIFDAKNWRSKSRRPSWFCSYQSVTKKPRIYLSKNKIRLEEINLIPFCQAPNKRRQILRFCFYTTTDMESTEKKNDKNESGESKPEKPPPAITHRRRPLSCTICIKEFIYQSDLVKHMTLHTGETFYTCEFCGRNFAENIAFRKHMFTHTGIKPFECDICELKFSYHSSLKTHIRTHTGEKPFQCDICNSKFSVNSNLTKHMRTHTGEKPFHCTVCSSKFSDSSKLKRHMLIHTGERPFQCEICFSRFSVNSHLTEHMRIHTGEKPFQCEMCESKFSHSSSLKQHIRTHTREKPFLCDICGSNFLRNSHLRKHLQTHTEGKPFHFDISCASLSEASNPMTDLQEEKDPLWNWQVIFWEYALLHVCNFWGFKTVWEIKISKIKIFSNKNFWKNFFLHVLDADNTIKL